MLSFPFAFNLVSFRAFQLVAVKQPRSIAPGIFSLFWSARIGWPQVTRKIWDMSEAWKVWIWARINSGIGPVVSDTIGIIIYQPNRYMPTFLHASCIFDFLHVIVSSLRILRDEESENETILEEPEPVRCVL
jgi:hypothetical protein